jgi:membrane-bound lytic murein transglycosylase B
VLVSAVVLAGLLPATADAETAQQAQAEADRAAADVRAMQPRLQAAVDAYRSAVGALGSATGTEIDAARTADEADRAVVEAAAAQTRRVRALYMNGGQLGLLTTVLDAEGPADLMQRLTAVDRVLSADTHDLGQARAQAQRAHEGAADETAAADRATVYAEQVQADFAQAQALLATAQDRLSSLTARARSLAAVEAAQRTVDAAGLVISTATRDAVGKVQGKGIPAAFLTLYQSAAQTCPGLDWHVLAAIGQVESGHGRNNGPSSGGAMGPMQFLPSTFRAYAVDGDHDGVADIWNPADAIFSAAHYVCANGAGNPRKLYTAIWHYNHADWYVQMVLRVADSLRLKYP